MDVEFDLQDVFALIRPQLKIIPTLEEAGAAFAEACKEQYQMSAPDRPSTPLNDEELDGPDGAVDLDGRRTPDLDDKSSEEDEAEVSPRVSCLYIANHVHSLAITKLSRLPNCAATTMRKSTSSFVGLRTR